MMRAAPGRSFRSLAFVLLALLVSACTSELRTPFDQLESTRADAGSDLADVGVEPDGNDSEPDADTRRDADAHPDTSTDPVEDPLTEPDAGDTAVEDSAQSDASVDGDIDDTEPPVEEEVRFVAFGDWGGIVSRIERAADAMWAHCQIAGCDFAIGLGDNFYDYGVTGTDDPQWQDKFLDPFAEWDIPLFMTLGNHDYLGNEQAQVDFTLLDDRWTMPARYYDLVAGPVHFFATDTNALTLEQLDWLVDGLHSSTSPWRVAFGHHLWRSNGVHGDSPPSRRKFQEWAYCNQLDLLVSGHDHDLQHLAAECGVDQIISGAIAYPRAAGTGDNTLFAYGSDYGFAWLSISESRLRLEFYDLDGELLYSWERERAERLVECTADDYCEPACSNDPDCLGLDCSADDSCNDRCVEDPDCYGNCPCDYNFGICEPIANPSTVRCACDPQCRGEGRPCRGDGHCDTWCPSGVDPDCG